MNQSKRIVVNAIASYVRMALTIGVSLATVRLLLAALGSEGYGLFVALVASGTFAGFISTSFTSSAQRYIAYSLGQDDLDRQKQQYHASQLIFVGLAGAIAFFGTLLSPLILNLLTIPDGYYPEARIAFLFSIANIVVLSLASPLNATIQAHQDIVYTSVIELLERCSLFLLVVCIPVFPTDPIVAYAGCILGVSMIRFLISAVFAAKRYREVSLVPRWVGWEPTKPIVVYAAITLGANIGITLREQGAVVLLNSFFGPVVNAAYSIAQQLAGYATRLSSSITAVLSPAAATKEGTRDGGDSTFYANLASRYSLVAISVLAVPMLLDMDVVLGLWLGSSFPVQAAIFSVFTVLIRVFGVMSWGDNVVAQAKGRIAIISIIQSVPAGLAVLIVAVVYSFERTEFGPILLPSVMLGVTIVNSTILKPMWVGSMIGRSWMAYLKQVPIRCLLTIAPATTAAIMLRISLPQVTWRLYIELIVYVVLVVPGMWFIGMDQWEKTAWKSVLTRRGRTL